ncbi:response regulator [Polaribacter butkevichii]|uniref:Response regulatory domain-containing protein n=1 Tax=Polaribacter butkevichii TaxID=218490 RepID=A0A2P6C7M5_9FLAO|nr:response regulator [Polaribacter butkevichii]PQJ68947.1 hypothetical protein BTO14_12955 [Polaribacter butkevichii]
MKSTLSNLLIVEDNSFIGKSIVNAAKKNKGIKHIHLTEFLQEAIALFSTTNYDLVILDLKLPDGNGIELLKMLKEKQIETKVFVFSVSIELKSYCLKYGVCTFFDKTKDFDQLIEAITNA